MFFHVPHLRFFLRLLPVFIASNLAGQPNPIALRSIVERQLGEAVSPDHAGTAVAVVKDDSVLLTATYGLANLEHRVRVTDSTVFHVASVSKQFTGFAIAQLIATGRVALTDPVRHYLPDFPSFSHEVTVEHLIYHTSGLREWSTTLFLAGRAGDDSFTNADVRRMVAAQQELNFLPGSQFRYTNTNYTLLAEIVTAVTGLSFADYLEQEVFGPLGMTHTVVRDDLESIIPNRAGSYFYRNDTAFDAVDNLAVTGASGIYASIADLAKWGRNLFRQQLGVPEAYTLLRRPGYLNDGTKIEYGFGFWIGNFYGTDWIDHTGSWAGNRAYSTYFPEHDLAIFTLKNYDERDYLGQHLAVAVLEGELQAYGSGSSNAPAPDTVPVAFEAGPHLPGVYRLAPDRFLRLAVRNGALYGAVFPAAYGDTVYSAEEAVVRRSGDTLALAGLNLRFRPNTNGAGFSAAGQTYRPLEQDDAGNPAGYVGSYYSDELNVGYEVRRTDKGLQIGNLNNGRFPLRHIAGDDYDVPVPFLDFVRFVRDGAGRVTGLAVSTERSVNQYFRKIPEPVAQTPRE